MDFREESGIGFDEYFEASFAIRKASDVLAENADGHDPERLLSTLWRRGELAVMFGASDTGKSMFATQIGRALATGEAIGPFDVQGGPRRVLYLDIKLTDQQWASRYVCGKTPEQRKIAEFPDNFKRVSLFRDGPLPDGCKNFTQVLLRSVEKAVRLKRPDVLIIDNITQLKHSNDITRDVIPLMQELSRLKREFGLSILVLARSEPRAWTTGVEIGDLRSASVICNYADTVFGIGKTATGDLHYVKHLRSYSGETLYNSSHTAVFRIGRNIASNFIGFMFEHFASEHDVRRGSHGHVQSPHVDEAKRLFDTGLSYREVGEKLGVSKTSAHRWVQMWKPPEQRCKHDYRPPPVHPPEQPIVPVDDLRWDSG